MKPDEIRNLEISELKAKLYEVCKKYKNIKVEIEMIKQDVGQNAQKLGEKIKEMLSLKKSIARIKTILREKGIKV